MSSSSQWGLRGRWFRRLVAAWLIVLGTTAAIADDCCCCGGCGGWLTSLNNPEYEEADRVAQPHLRSSEAVRSLVGEITSITFEEEPDMYGSPRVDSLQRASGGATLYKIWYVIVGSTSTVTIVAYVVKRATGWVVEAVEHEGAFIEGEDPTDTSSGGGSGGGGSSGGGGFDWD
jgi:uncharacterized membrane protein YgcG